MPSSAGVQIFWDSNFKVKSLEPVFQDSLSVTSPLTLASSATQNLRVDPSAKAVLFSRDPAQTTTKLKIEVSKVAIPGTPVAEPGYVTVDLNDGPYYLSLENITGIMLTNADGGTRNFQFQFLLVP